MLISNLGSYTNISSKFYFQNSLNSILINVFIFFLIAFGSGSISNIDVDMNEDISKITVEVDNYINEGLGIEFNEPAITIKNKKKIELNLDLNVEKIGSQGRKMVRCKVCYLYPQTVLINCKQKKITYHLFVQN